MKEFEKIVPVEFYRTTKLLFDGTEAKEATIHIALTDWILEKIMENFGSEHSVLTGNIDDWNFTPRIMIFNKPGTDKILMSYDINVYCQNRTDDLITFYHIDIPDEEMPAVYHDLNQGCKDILGKSFKEMVISED